jgi:hypothetical protein
VVAVSLRNDAKSRKISFSVSMIPSDPSFSNGALITPTTVSIAFPTSVVAVSLRNDAKSRKISLRIELPIRSRFNSFAAATSELNNPLAPDWMIPGAVLVRNVPMS